MPARSIATTNLSVRKSSIQQPLADELIERVARALPNQPGPACVSLALPGVRIRGLPSGLQGASYWARSASEQRQLSIGRAWQTDAFGPGRLESLNAARRAFSARLTLSDPDRTGLSPRFLMMATFADETTAALPQAPSASLWLPQVLLEESDGHCRLCVASPGDWKTALTQLLTALNQPPEQGTQAQCFEHLSEAPATASWLEEAERALGAIRGGHLKKVVLARRIEIHGRHPFDPARLVAVLGVRHPKTTVFALNTNQGYLVSATPERLLSAGSGQVQCDALAGTAPRGSTPERDRQIGNWLLNDNKNRHEHELVVDAIRKALTVHCVEPLAPTEPRLYRTGGLQHLHTPIGGRLRPGQHALSLAQTLHPTPAVGGTPKQTALEWIRRHESVDRGWFAGLAGWVASDGDTELNVILRCAFLQGSRAFVHAGAGLVEDSKPEQELAEIELKMSVLLEALKET